MSLAIKYEALEDARMRLKGTVVRYKGDPVYITEITPGNADEIHRVYYKEVPFNAPKPKPFRNMEEIVADAELDAAKRKYISSKFFDIEPFRMGYVNSPNRNGAFFCSRLPNRIQKQGLCGENFRAMDNFGVMVDFNTFLNTKEVLEMINDRYPTFNQALAGLNKVPSVAFSRNFALVKDAVIPDLLYLYHKGEKVGMYNSATKFVSLGVKFQCLKESLNELGVHC